jgi:hypothetical protein
MMGQPRFGGYLVPRFGGYLVPRFGGLLVSAVPRFGGADVALDQCSLMEPCFQLQEN